MAHLSQDENLINSFNNGDDVHRMTASRVFDIDYDKVTPLIPCVELTDPVPLSPAPDALFRRIEVSRLVLEADTIINLPKMKTHGQMLLTLGVKNLFGCIVGRRKAYSDRKSVV